MAEAKKIPKEKKPTKTAKKGLSAPLYDLTGKELEVIELPESIFGITVSDSLLADYIRVYQTNRRFGNASAKTRSEVVGSTKKIYRQKGTGRARHGANKAPIFVGGGVAHGPTGKVFALSMNKKQKRKALFSLLTAKLKDNKISFVKGLLGVKPKTKEMALVIKNFDTANKGRVLLTFPKAESRNMVLASRNLAGVTLKDVQSLNGYDVLVAQKIIFAHEGLNILKDHYEH